MILHFSYSHSENCFTNLTLKNIFQQLTIFKKVYGRISSLQMDYTLNLMIILHLNRGLGFGILKRAYRAYYLYKAFS